MEKMFSRFLIIRKINYFVYYFLEGPPPSYKQVIDSDFINAGGNSVYRNTTIPVNQYNTNNLFNRIRIEKEKYYF